MLTKEVELFLGMSKSSYAGYEGLVYIFTGTTLNLLPYAMALNVEIFYATGIICVTLKDQKHESIGNKTLFDPNVKLINLINGIKRIIDEA